MDDEGYLYFQGRNDDIIKSRGEKVSPVEIENFLFKIKGIKEVAVVGIPDIIMGESIVVFITTEKNTPLTEKDIKKECTAHFESFMVPYKVIFINEMPKNNNTKIDKLVLKKIYSNAIKEKN
ncbi:MAG: hypothetical protein ABIN48_07905 [Ginsengibacter sp.]